MGGLYCRCAAEAVNKCKLGGKNVAARYNCLNDSDLQLLALRTMPRQVAQQAKYWSRRGQRNLGDEDTLPAYRRPHRLRRPRAFQFLSSNHDETLSDLWYQLSGDISAMGLAQIKKIANQSAKVLVANNVGPTVTAVSVDPPGQPPAITGQFSVPNLFYAVRNNKGQVTALQHAPVPTLDTFQILIYKVGDNK